MRTRGIMNYRMVDEKTIAVELTFAYEALADLEDLEHLQGHNWYASFDSRGRVSAKAKINKKNVYMQHWIFGQPIYSDTVVDHMNKNSIDNRKENLTFATLSENGQNSDRTENAIGITYNRRERKWKAYYRPPNTQRVHLGTFKTEQEALNAVKTKKEELICL